MDNIRKIVGFYNPKKNRVIDYSPIVERIIKHYPVGVTIIVPSSSPLNEHIAQKIIRKVENARILKNILCKLTTEDVEDIVLAPNSVFRQYYKADFVPAYNELAQYLELMEKTRNGYFTRYLIIRQEVPFL